MDTDGMVDVKMRQRFLQLDATYDHLLSFRAHVKKISKLAKHYGQLSQEAATVSRHLSECLAELPVHSGCKPGADESLALFGSTLAKLDSDHFAVVQQLEPFFEGIIKAYMPDEEVKAAGELHRRISQTMNDYDAAHRKKAQKHGTDDDLHELELRFNSLYQMHKKRVMRSLVFGSFDVAERMSSFVFLMTNSVTQGFNSMRELEPTVNLLMSKLEQSRVNYEVVNNPARRSHLSMEVEHGEQSGVEKQGYLFRKHRGGGWKLNWVAIRDTSFLVYKKWKNFEPLVSIDMSIATVKPSIESGAHKLEVWYKLEVISPNERVELRALTLRDHEAWIAVFENAIKASLRDSNPTEETTPTTDMAALHAIAGNEVCADCKAELPEWVSLNLGVLICLECSGIHRSLGTHVSKVRSLCLDKIPRAQFRILELIGNSRANAFWLYQADSSSAKITPKTDRTIKAQFITAKYVEKLFIPPLELSEDELYDALFEAVQSIDVISISRNISHGANVNRVYYGKPLIHYAVMLGSTSCTEFLLQNDCMPNSEDENGLTALDQAILLNHRNCQTILECRGGERGSNAAERDAATTVSGEPLPRLSIGDITPAEAKARHLSAASDMKETITRLLNPLPAGNAKVKPNRLPPLPPISARGSRPLLEPTIAEKPKRFVTVERVIDKPAPLSPPSERLSPRFSPGPAAREERTRKTIPTKPVRARSMDSTVAKSHMMIAQQTQPQLRAGRKPGHVRAQVPSLTAAIASIPTSTIARASETDMDFGVSYATFDPKTMSKPNREPPSVPTSPRGYRGIDRLAALISPRSRGTDFTHEKKEEKEKVVEKVDVDTSKAKWTKPPIPDAIFKLLDSTVDGEGANATTTTTSITTGSSSSVLAEPKWVKKSDLPADILKKLAEEPENQHHVPGSQSPRQKRKSKAVPVARTRLTSSASPAVPITRHQEPAAVTNSVPTGMVAKARPTSPPPLPALPIARPSSPPALPALPIAKREREDSDDEASGEGEEESENSEDSTDSEDLPSLEPTIASPRAPRIAPPARPKPPGRPATQRPGRGRGLPRGRGGPPRGQASPRARGARGGPRGRGQSPNVRGRGGAPRGMRARGGPAPATTAAQPAQGSTE